MGVAAVQVADADAEPHRHLSAADGERPAHGGGERVGQHQWAAGGDEDELVAAESGDHVAVGGQPVEAVGDGGEVVVAELVVVAVVDAVHVIDVGDRDAQLDTDGGGEVPLGDAAHG